MNTRRSDLGIVVIGRNEGDRLRVCISSARRECDRVVYVDSDSSDGSPDAARALGADVVALQPPGLTAARGRQAGVASLLERWPDIEFIQFVDGDCELAAGWLDQALAAMATDSRLAAVSGIRSEASTQHNLWSRLVDIEWPRTGGDVLYPGGDSLCRVSALQAIGGWTVDLIAGEDPDLGFRLVDAGWHVRRLAIEMTVHDIRITRFGQYWRRAVRSGFAYAAAGWRNRHGVGRVYLIRGLKFTLQAALLAGTLVASALYWPFALAAVAIVIWVWCRSFRFSSRAGLRGADSLLYALLAIPVRFAQGLGFVRALLGISRGERASLIEYRAALPTDSPEFP